MQEPCSRERPDEHHAFAHAVERLPRLVRRGRAPRRPRRELVRARRDGDQARTATRSGSRSSASSTTGSRRPATRTSTSRCSCPSRCSRRKGELVEGLRARGRRRHARRAARSSRSRSSCGPPREAIIWSTYARWMQSYRDLPLLYNQWANVVRWELRPRLFLRTTEFLWQEGHTAHETEDEAVAEALTILHDVYADTIESVLAIPVLRGRKSDERALPRRRRDLHARSADARRQGAAGRRPRTTSARTSRARSTSATPARDGSRAASVRDVVGRDDPAGRRRRDGARRRPRAAAAASRRAAAGRDRARSPASDDARARARGRRRARRASCGRRASASASTTGPSTAPGVQVQRVGAEGRAAAHRARRAATSPPAAVTVVRRDTGEKQQIPLPPGARRGSTSCSARCRRALFAGRPRRTGAPNAPRPAQLRRADRAPPRRRRIRRRAVVRPPRVRSARQGGQLGDDPLPAARRAAGPPRRMCLLRPPGGHRGRLGAGLLGRPGRRRRCGGPDAVLTPMRRSR